MRKVVGVMSVMGRSLSTIRVHCFADIPDGGKLAMEVLLFRRLLKSVPEISRAQPGTIKSLMENHENFTNSEN